MAQFGLHPARPPAEVVLVKDADRGVFHRSREQAGLRYVSPSLMAADLDQPDAFEAALALDGRARSAVARIARVRQPTLRLTAAAAAHSAADSAATGKSPSSGTASSETNRAAPAAPTRSQA